jgi:hypothetical protein
MEGRGHDRSLRETVSRRLMAGAYYLKRRTCKHRARVSDDLEDPAMHARWPLARDGGGPSSKQAVPPGLGASISLRLSCQCPESLAVFRAIVTTNGVFPLLESQTLSPARRRPHRALGLPPAACPAAAFGVSVLGSPRLPPPARRGPSGPPGHATGLREERAALGSFWWS